MTTRKGEDPLWLTALGLLVVLLVAAGIPATVYFFAAKHFQPAITAPESVDMVLLEDPDAGPVMAMVKRHYADDYAEVRDEALGRLRAGASPFEVTAEAEERVQRISRSYLPDVAQASDGDLQALREARLRILDQLAGKEHADACATFLSGSRNRALFPMEIHPLLTELEALQWRVAASGRDHPVDRKLGPATSDEGVAFAKALRDNGMTDGDFEILGQAQGMRGVTAEKRCAIGTRVVRALEDIPATQGNRLFALSIVEGAR